MEATRSSETSVLTRHTRRYIPEDGTLHSHRCENLKSYILSCWWRGSIKTQFRRCDELLYPPPPNHILRYIHFLCKVSHLCRPQCTYKTIQLRKLLAPSRAHTNIISHGIAPSVLRRAGYLCIRCSIPGRGKRITLLCSVENAYEAHPACTLE
jgi:hypothetical protein